MERDRLKAYAVAFWMQSDLAGRSLTKPPFYVVAADESGAIMSAMVKLSPMQHSMLIPGESPVVRRHRGRYPTELAYRVFYEGYPGARQTVEVLASSIADAKFEAVVRGIDISNIKGVEALFDTLPES